MARMSEEAYRRELRRLDGGTERSYRVPPPTSEIPWNCLTTGQKIGTSIGFVIKSAILVGACYLAGKCVYNSYEVAYGFENREQVLKSESHLEELAQQEEVNVRR